MQTAGDRRVPRAAAFGQSNIQSHQLFRRWWSEFGAGCTRTKPKSSKSSRSSRTVSRTTRGRISPRSPFTVARLPYPRWTGARRMAARLMGFRRAGEWGGLAVGTRWDRRPHRPAAAAVEGGPTRILGPSAVWCLPVFAVLRRVNSVSCICSFFCT